MSFLFSALRIRCLLGRASFLIVVFSSLVLAQTPGSRVLVVYNENSPASLDVAGYYAAQRGVPPGNLCAVAPSSTTELSIDAYRAEMLEPVQRCLYSAGPPLILYIVLAYDTPYRVSIPSGMTYALDQYLADPFNWYTTETFDPIPNAPHTYFAGAQVQGGAYAPFLPLAVYRTQPGSQLIYSVWRLDAATPALAKGLVDKAKQAEATGLHGRVCVDRWRAQDVNSVFDWSYGSGDWEIFRAGNFLARAGFEVIDDGSPVEFGTPPAASTCPDAAFYAGWYSFNHYNDVFTWAPGAIGVHLDSFSAGDPRGGSNWAANALQRGITVTTGAVNEPYLDGLLHVSGAVRNLLEGANVGDAFLRNTPWLKWMILNLGDPLYTPFPGGVPSALADTSALALQSRYVLAGNPVDAEVQLAQPAPAGGTSVALASTFSGVVVPPNITVPEGATRARFTVSTQPVSDEISVFIRATAPGFAATNTLIVAPVLAEISLSSPVGTAGLPLTGTVYLNDVAPAGGITIALGTSHPALVGIPASVTVPAGQRKVSFPVTTTPVPVRTDVVIAAAYGETTVTTLLVLQPAIVNGSLAPATIGVGAAATLDIYLGYDTPVPATIAFTCSNPGVASVSGSVTIPPGRHLGTATVSGTGAGTATITATYLGSTFSAVVTVR